MYYTRLLTGHFPDVAIHHTAATQTHKYISVTGGTFINPPWIVSLTCEREGGTSEEGDVVGEGVKDALCLQTFCPPHPWSCIQSTPVSPSIHCLCRTHSSIIECRRFSQISWNILKQLSACFFANGTVLLGRCFIEKEEVLIRFKFFDKWCYTYRQTNSLP